MNLPLILALFGAATSQRLTPVENQQLQSICGTYPGESPRRLSSRSLIFGGIPVSAETAPFAIQLLSQSNECSGTIISSRHVLTARHCLDSNLDRNFILQRSQTYCSGSDRVHSGYFRGFSIRLPNGNYVQGTVTKMYVLKACPAPTEDDDIMILELNSNIPLSPLTHPACILKNSNELAGQPAIALYSYGSTAYDRSVTSGTGVLQYGLFKLMGFRNNGMVLDVQEPTRRFATRPGDSGGGYLMRIGGRGTIVGVHFASWEMNGKEMGQLGANVAYFYNPICSYTGIC